MKGTRVALATVAMLAALVACGDVDSSDPAGSSGGGAAGGGAGGGGSMAARVCPGFFFDSRPREARLTYQGTNGTFEDHCDEMGRLVQYGCATRVYCTPTPENPCPGDLGVAYPTGQVSPYIIDCACSDGVCPAH